MASAGVDIPGPIDRYNASHWITYDHENFTVETWCKMGPDYRFILRTRVRPMCESEIIHSKIRGHSREAVLKAYGVTEEPISSSKPGGFFSRLFKRGR